MVIDVARMNDVYGSQVGNNMLQPLNVPRCPKTTIVLILATSKDGQWLIPQEKQQNN